MPLRRDPRSPTSSDDVGKGEPTGDITVVRLGESQRIAGIQALLGGDRPAADRFLTFAAKTHVRLEGLWAVLGMDGRPELVLLAAPSPGRTATLFATLGRSRADLSALGSLVDAACTAMPEFGVHLAQALVDPRELLQLEAYERGGMRRLATLSYLERPLPIRPVAARHGAHGANNEWPNDIRAEPWDPSQREELVAALERTYIDTLDCPALAGLRRGEDVLEGHLHSGRFEAPLWTLLRFGRGPHDSQLAGMCLLNGAHPATGSAGSVELVYLGLVPEARGRGLGRRLLEHGLALLKGRSERAVVLAVDERNTPAMKLYREAGFRPSLRRVAFIRPVVRETC
ncbi:MAG: GNAT family N-acetyltransferase [Phycisphaerae bacterium]|nr:GNAT family N-acetyltransferase [Phycisphaerae bacterium]